jgi:hypothetical protein
MTTKDRHHIEGKHGTSTVRETADAVSHVWTSESPSGTKTFHADEGAAIERAEKSSGRKP